MGQSLAKLKDEMIFNQDLTRLVDAMKGIAAAQYHVMDHKRTKVTELEKSLDELFTVYDFRSLHHPFVRPCKERRLICAVTTDSGFLGGLNMKVTQAAMKLEEDDSMFLLIGERGATSMKEFGKKVIALPGINADDTRHALVDQTVKEITARLVKKEFGKVIMIYPHPTSFSSQRIESLNLLPCPAFYKNRAPQVPTSQQQAKGVILESAPGPVVEYLTEVWLRKRLTEIFEYAKMAEFGARVMHLEESYSTLTKSAKALKLQFFKARREKIDASLRETFSAKLVNEE